MARQVRQKAKGLEVNVENFILVFLGVYVEVLRDMRGGNDGVILICKPQRYPE